MTNTHKPPSRTSILDRTRDIRRSAKSLDNGIKAWGTDFDRLPEGNRNFLLERLNEIEGTAAQIREMLGAWS